MKSCKLEPELRFCPALLSYLVVFSHVCHVDQNEAEASHYNNKKKTRSRRGSLK